MNEGCNDYAAIMNKELMTYAEHKHDCKRREGGGKGETGESLNIRTRRGKLNFFLSFLTVTLSRAIAFAVQSTCLYKNNEITTSKMHWRGVNSY